MDPKINWMKRKLRLFLLVGLVLLVVTGCDEEKGDRKTDEQIAADFVKSLGYTVVVSEGESSSYTLERKMLETLDYMQLWAVQKQAPDDYFGQEIVTYPFIVKNHPLEKLYSPDNYDIAVMVMLVNGKVIGGASSPRSKIKNLVVAGGEYSVDGQTLKEIKGMDYSEWLDYWKKTYGKQL